jgi:protein gp37
MFTAQRRYGQDPEVIKRTASATWKEPYRWHREAVTAGTAARVFTCSWSDFFHKDADPWRPEAWQVIRDTPALQYQILTKRPGRIRQSLPPDWAFP